MAQTITLKQPPVLIIGEDNPDAITSILRYVSKVVSPIEASEFPNGEPRQISVRPRPEALYTITPGFYVGIGSSPDEIKSAVDHFGRPDMVSLDYNLIGGTGIEVAKWLRGAYGSELPIIMLTSLDNPPGASEAGIDRILNKSHLGDLGDAVAQLMILPLISRGIEGPKIENSSDLYQA